MLEPRACFLAPMLKMLKMLLMLLMLLPLSPGCISVNSAYENPSIQRLVSVPEGARVYVLRLNLGGMHTPVDLPRDVMSSDTVRIQKQGYHSWEGKLAELWQESQGCFVARLRKKE